jgi:hypothetical protein
MQPLVCTGKIANLYRRLFFPSSLDLEVVAREVGGAGEPSVHAVSLAIRILVDKLPTKRSRKN